MKCGVAQAVSTTSPAMQATIAAAEYRLTMTRSSGPPAMTRSSGPPARPERSGRRLFVDRAVEGPLVQRPSDSGCLKPDGSFDSAADKEPSAAPLRTSGRPGWVL